VKDYSGHPVLHPFGAIIASLRCSNSLIVQGCTGAVEHREVRERPRRISRTFDHRIKSPELTPHTIHKTQVLHTMMNGKVFHDALGAGEAQ